MSGAAVLVGLLEAIIDREADRVERIQGEVDKLSQTIFGVKGGERTRSLRFDVSIRAIGREGELTSQIARKPADARTGCSPTSATS